MPRLDDRLKAVASMIRCNVLADIGSDHGHLLKALLASGRIIQGIAVENKTQPWRHSANTLQGWAADLRFADGLEGLAIGEVDCVSLCGMGGETITKILTRYPDRVPDVVVVQPNKRPDLVRLWALGHAVDLVDECVVTGSRDFDVIRFERNSTTNPVSIRGSIRSGEGSASANSVPVIDAVRQPLSVDAGSEFSAGLGLYAGLDLNAALWLGPRNLRRMDDQAISRLDEERDYLRGLPSRSLVAEQRLAAIDWALTRSKVSSE
ncbi:MAG: tRNA (adenine(22)-N(1))-methyltransferase TrmK [Planctomycetota bacterium]